MYCSLRLFIDKTPNLTKRSNFLKVVELCSSIFNKSIDYLTYNVDNVYEDKMLVNKKFKYNEKGIEKFKNTEINCLEKGENGNDLSTFLSAMNKCDELELFSDVCIFMHYPIIRWPLVIYIDLKLFKNKGIDFNKYTYLIKELNEIGYHVNNGFYSIYLKKARQVHYVV